MTKRKMRLCSRCKISEAFWKPGIVGAYRHPSISFKESLYSVFKLHNETLNIWTHFGAMVFFIGYLYTTSTRFNLYSDDMYNPLLCVFITISVFTFSSSLAHTFNSMSECSQDIGFIIDYYGISLYAFGSAISNFAYGFPKNWHETIIERYFLVINAFTSVLSVYLACKSRFRKFGVVAKTMRLTGFLLAYMVSMSPLFYRVIIEYSIHDATFYYWRHFVAAVFTIAFFASHFPETAFPGKFDIYFHSHQLFHVAGSTGTYYKLTGLIMDIQLKHFILSVPGSIKMLLGLAMVNALLAGYFIYRKYVEHRNFYNYSPNFHSKGLLVNNNQTKHE